MKHLIRRIRRSCARAIPPASSPRWSLPCLRRIQEDRGYVADSDIDALVDVSAACRASRSRRC